MRMGRMGRMDRMARMDRMGRWASPCRGIGASCNLRAPQGQRGARRRCAALGNPAVRDGCASIPRSRRWKLFQLSARYCTVAVDDRVSISRVASS